MSERIDIKLDKELLSQATIDALPLTLDLHLGEPLPGSSCTRVDVTTVGADPTGGADSSPMIQRAIEAAGTRGVVYFPPGVYRLDETVRVERNDQTWMAYGAELKANFMSAPVVVCGRADATHQRIRLLGLRVTRNGAPDWSPGSAGIVFHNTTYGVARDFSVIGFRAGLQVLGTDGRGQLYGTFSPQSIWSYMYPVQFLASGVGSAVNENMLLGNGSLKFVRRDPSAAQSYAVWVGSTDGGHQPNNVKVFGLSLETQVVDAGMPKGAVWCDGLECAFIGLRYEGFAAPFIHGPLRARHNFFAASHGLRLDSLDWDNMGRDQHVLATDVWHCGGDLHVVGRVV